MDDLKLQRAHVFNKALEGKWERVYNPLKGLTCFWINLCSGLANVCTFKTMVH